MDTTVTDEKRKCGWRREGAYLVSADGAVGEGGVEIDESAAGVLVLNPPVAVNPDNVPHRGYVYIDGEALLRGDGVVRIDADLAEARAWSWRVFGIDAPDRIGAGICAGTEGVEGALDAVTSLTWRDRPAYREHAGEVWDLVQEARSYYGDATAAPLLAAASQALDLSTADYGLQGAGAALAAFWRLVDLGRRLELPGVVQTAARMMHAAGAAADVGAALRYRPPSYRVAPDILDYVGQSHYPTPETFVDEADRLKADGAPMGVSRRVAGPGSLPRGIAAPYTRSFLAHNQVDFDGHRAPGVFGYYLASQVQYVTGRDGRVPAAARAHGVALVRVERAGERERELLPA